jgi:hypothetical protein
MENKGLIKLLRYFTLLYDEMQKMTASEYCALPKLSQCIKIISQQYEKLVAEDNGPKEWIDWTDECLPLKKRFIELNLISKSINGKQIFIPELASATEEIEFTEAYISPMINKSISKKDTDGLEKTLTVLGNKIKIDLARIIEYNAHFVKDNNNYDYFLYENEPDKYEKMVPSKAEHKRNIKEKAAALLFFDGDFNEKENIATDDPKYYENVLPLVEQKFDEWRSMCKEGIIDTDIKNIEGKGNPNSPLVSRSAIWRRMIKENGETKLTTPNLGSGLKKTAETQQQQ